jgi:hypothetical protein
MNQVGGSIPEECHSPGDTNCLFLYTPTSFLQVGLHLSRIFGARVWWVKARQVGGAADSLP